VITKLKQIDFKWFPIGLIIIYIPFHILEEAINNFPLWMFEHYKLPKPLSYPHWLINNSIFLIILLIGLIIYSRDRIKNISFGLAIVFWAFMNSIEHIGFSIFDLKLSPGIYTAILFLIISTVGLIKLRVEKILNPALLLKSFLIAISYWIASFIIIISIGLYLVKIFP
jgi:Protein of unknown function with HXXEE motif